MGSTVCPRCGHRDSFLPDYLHNSCVCQVCESQLDWREIPGCGPDCRAVDEADGNETPAVRPGDEAYPEPKVGGGGEQA
jgi:hypothetical protein